MRSKEWDKLPKYVSELIERHQVSGAVKLGALAKDLGLTVKTSSLPPGISGEIRPDPDSAGKFVIRVNRHEDIKRQRFTLAHEIAHALLHADEIGRQGVIQDNVLFRSSLSNSLEVEANKLAADILMPWSLIKTLWEKWNELSQNERVQKIAEELEVSQTALKIRLGLS